MHELDLAVLDHDVPEHGLCAGDVGTIVLVHRGGEAYEVEFVTRGGETLAVLTLAHGEVRPFTDREVLHARDLARS